MEATTHSKGDVKNIVVSAVVVAFTKIHNFSHFTKLFQYIFCVFMWSTSNYLVISCRF